MRRERQRPNLRIVVLVATWCLAAAACDGDQQNASALDAGGEGGAASDAGADSAPPHSPNECRQSSWEGGVRACTECTCDDCPARTLLCDEHCVRLMACLLRHRCRRAGETQMPCAVAHCGAFLGQMEPWTRAQALFPCIDRCTSECHALPQLGVPDAGVPDAGAVDAGGEAGLAGPTAGPPLDAGSDGALDAGRE
ncbi:MAG: hypothetical protein MJD61_17610 [Proteobacteria bacterium]|nr:hypothetical protein [Pseudomonadota bacterium]